MTGTQFSPIAWRRVYQPMRCGREKPKPRRIRKKSVMCLVALDSLKAELKAIEADAEATSVVAAMPLDSTKRKGTTTPSATGSRSARRQEQVDGSLVVDSPEWWSKHAKRFASVGQTAEARIAARNSGTGYAHRYLSGKSCAWSNADSVEVTLAIFYRMLNRKQRESFDAAWVNAQRVAASICSCSDADPDKLAHFLRHGGPRRVKQTRAIAVGNERFERWLETNTNLASFYAGWLKIDVHEAVPHSRATKPKGHAERA